MLEASNINVTGSQMTLSQTLGVIPLAITPSAQYATTTQMSFLIAGCHADLTSPARSKTHVERRCQFRQRVLLSSICIRSLPANAALKTLVVLDDRHDAEAARRDGLVWNGASPVMDMTTLQRQAGMSMTIQ